MRLVATMLDCVYFNKVLFESAALRPSLVLRFCVYLPVSFCNGLPTARYNGPFNLHTSLRSSSVHETFSQQHHFPILYYLNGLNYILSKQWLTIMSQFISLVFTLPVAFLNGCNYSFKVHPTTVVTTSCFHSPQSIRHVTRWFCFLSADAILLSWAPQQDITD